MEERLKEFLKNLGSYKKSLEFNNEIECISIENDRIVLNNCYFVAKVLDMPYQIFYDKKGEYYTCEFVFDDTTYTSVHCIDPVEEVELMLDTLKEKNTYVD